MTARFEVQSWVFFTSDEIPIMKFKAGTIDRPHSRSHSTLCASSRWQLFLVRLERTYGIHNQHACGNLLRRQTQPKLFLYCGTQGWTQRFVPCEFERIGPSQAGFINDRSAQGSRQKLDRETF